MYRAYKFSKFNKCSVASARRRGGQIGVNYEGVANGKLHFDYFC